MKFNVTGNVMYNFSLVVDAESEDEAEQLAKDLIDDGTEVTTYDAPSIDVWDVSEEPE